MARVLFYTGIGLLTVSAALLYLPTCFYFIIGLLILGVVLSVVFHKRLHIAWLTAMLVIILMFSLVGNAVLQFKVEPAEKLSNYNARVVGTVSDWPVHYKDYSVYTLKAEKIEIIYKENQHKLSKVPQNLKIRLSDINNIDADIFDKIEVEVAFNSLGEYRNSSLSNGVYASGYVEKLFSFKGQNRPFYAIFYDLRSYINNLLYDNINYDEATVISAVLLGDRSRLSDDFYYDSKAAGVTHVLVVSGMHLGIIFQLIGGCFRLLGVSKRVTAVFLIGIIFVLSAVCGFTPSILRAGLTYFIMSVGIIIFRKPDPLNSLGAAAIVILFCNPFGFGNLSLLLSLLSTFGILYICPIIYEQSLKLLNGLGMYHKLFKAVAFALCQTVSATVAVAPISILCFGYISVISPLTNILIGYASTILVALALITAIILCLPVVFKAAATLPIIAMVIIVRYIVWAVDKCADVSWAILPTEPIYLIPWAFIAGALLLLPLLSLFKNKKRIKSYFRITLIVFLSFSLCAFGKIYQIAPKSRISVIDAGKGSCIVLNINKNIMVIGAGDTLSDADTIKNHLLSRGETRVDYLLLPSLKKSVAGGVPELIFELSPDNVVCPNNGDYQDKLQHISNDNFSFFNQRAVVKIDATSIAYLIADMGITINSKDFSLIVSVGDNVGELYDVATQKNVILICIDKIPNDVNTLKTSKIILSGSEEGVAQMKARLSNTTTSVLDSGNETLILNVGGDIYDK